MRRRYLIIALILMAIGFATVTTTLLINGRTMLRVNEADFIVYYSDAYVNGNQDLSVITDTNKIVFNTTLNLIGQKYVLDYDVTNGSKLYDADVEMVCTGGNDYLSVNNEFDDEEDLLTLATRRGTLTLEMIKSNAGDDIPVSIECTIVAKAVEKDEIVEEESPAEIFCKQLGYSYGMLAPTTYNDILDDHGEGSTETYCCSNDPDFNEYDGYDEEGELVSINGTPIQDPQTFCQSMNYSHGMLNANTYIISGDDEFGDITKAYYLCSNDSEFEWQIVGYDVEGNWVYEFLSNQQ